MALRVDEPAKPGQHFVHLPTRLWKLLLAGGFVTWLIAAVVTQITDDNILVPTVIIVGSFLVPVTMAAFALSRRRAGYLTTEEVVLGFLLAGTARRRRNRAAGDLPRCRRRPGRSSPSA